MMAEFSANQVILLVYSPRLVTDCPHVSAWQEC